MITLRNMYKHTTQEVFDVCALHLLNQNERSVSPSSIHSCMYRGIGGLKCAVGILIPEDSYHTSMEGAGVNKLAAEYRITNHVDILRDLQSLHDTECDVSQWKERLTHIAFSYGLSDERIANFGES
jgi:hypothetical protein